MEEKIETKKSCQWQDPFQNINPNITLEIKSFRYNYQKFGQFLHGNILQMLIHRKPNFQLFLIYRPKINRFEHELQIEKKILQYFEQSLIYGILY